MSLPHSTRSLVLSLLAAVTTTAASACGGDGATTAPAATAGARLQVVNAARTPVDVFVDGTVRVSALPAASVSPLLALDAGARQVALRPAGNAGGQVTASLVAQASSTALVAAQVGAAGALAAAVLDDSAAVPAPGTSKLRVLNLAPNAPAVDVWSLRPDQATGYRWVVPFRYGGATNFDQAAPGDREIVITPATPLRLTFASPRDSVVVAEDPRPRAIARLTVTLAADRARTVVLLDGPGGVVLALTGSP